MLVHVGTSGYNYPEWRGSFYPPDLATKAMFGFYSERFHAVEINYTFYRLPTPKVTESWRTQAPEGFTYVLKASRRITHDKRLKDCGEILQYFCESARALGPSLGPLLFQLPPTFRADAARLDDFLREFPRDLRAAFEFRHESWLNEAVYETLRTHGVALCIADSGERTTPPLATCRYGYFRLRDEGYQTSDLERWADVLAERSADWDDAFVFFKHEEEGKGPEFARTFVDLLRARQFTVA